MPDHNNPHVIRNLILFITATILSGWFGWFIAYSGKSADAQGLGQLIFLMLPFAMSLALRAFGGDGWKNTGFKPKFGENFEWYAVSFLVYPLVVACVILAGKITGQITLPGFSASKTGVFIQMLIAGFLPVFFKNIFEEFSWRGYLTPLVFKLGLNDFVSHGIVGLVWGIWHIPYYMGLLDRAVIHRFTPLPLYVFIPFVVLGLIAASIVFGEIRLLTGSVWPLVLMHTVSNVLINTLILEDFIKVQDSMALLITPGMEGIVSMVLIIIVGIGVYGIRKKKRTINV